MLFTYIRLICDGQNLTNTLHNCHTLVVLNIRGYAIGTNRWENSFLESSTLGNINQILSINSSRYPTLRKKTYALVNLNDCRTNELETSLMTTTLSDGCFDRQDFGDRKIEVVGLSTLKKKEVCRTPQKGSAEI